MSHVFIFQPSGDADSCDVRMIRTYKEILSRLGCQIGDQLLEGGQEASVVVVANAQQARQMLGETTGSFIVVLCRYAHDLPVGVEEMMMGERVEFIDAVGTNVPKMLAALGRIADIWKHF